MNRNKMKRGTLQRGVPDRPNFGNIVLQSRQLTIQAQAERDQAVREKDLAQTYLAAVLYEYGAAEDGVLISTATMAALQGAQFGIEKASDKDGLSLRLVVVPVVEAEEVLDEIASDAMLDEGAPI